MSRFPDGVYRAKALVADLGFTSKGSEQIAVEFELLGEQWEGQRITWYGYFTDKTEERTLESLRHCGWTGDDISENPLPGFGLSEVELVIEEDTYEGKTRSKVQFVNKPGGIAQKSPMNDAERKAFAMRMRGKIIAARQQVQPQLPPSQDPTQKLPF